MFLASSLAQFSTPAKAQQPGMEQARRSVAAAMSSPATVSPGHSKTAAARSASVKAAYSKKVLQERARKSYPRTHLERGFYLKQKNDPNGALLEFLKATQENPHLVRGFYEQALIFRSRGYRKLAESSLEQALAIQPTYNEARVLLATVRLEQGNFGGAVQELSRSLGLESNTSLNSSPENSSNSENQVPRPTSGLLSIDIPAILQSIHGVMKAPLSLVAGSDSGKTEASEAVAKNSTVSAEAKPASGVLPQSAEDTDHDKKKHTKKVRHKKSKNLLTYLRHGEELDDSSKKPESRQSSQSDAPANEQTTKTTNQTEIGEAKPSDEISLASLLKNDKPVEKSTYSEVPTFSSKRNEQNRYNTESSKSVQNGTTESAPPVFGNAVAFVAPQRNLQPSGLLNTILSAPLKSSAAASGKGSSNPSVKLDNDDWATKLKNYAEQGATSLKDGEAFMFAEDTGEASLFLADGTTIRRIVAQPKDSNEVMRERRPDISSAEDMLYGLSLLGKLIPKLDTQQSSSPTSVVPQQQPLGSFQGDNLMSGSQSFWGWLKSVCKF